MINNPLTTKVQTYHKLETGGTLMSPSTASFTSPWTDRVTTEEKVPAPETTPSSWIEMCIYGEMRLVIVKGYLAITRSMIKVQGEAFKLTNTTICQAWHRV